MKHTLKKLSETTVQATVTLDDKDLAAAKRLGVSHLAPKVKVPGFRAGKVPVDVAEKHIDPVALANEVAEHAINIALNDVATAESLRVLDQPKVYLKDFTPYESMTFEATIEILPEIKLGDYKKLKVKKAKVEVSDDEVEEVVERMRSQLSEKVEVKRVAEFGDSVNIDFVGKMDGKPFDGGAAEGYELGLGTSSFIPGFEEAIVGHKAGEKFDVPLSFPKDYHVEHLKGKAVVFEVTLHTVSEVKLPEVTDEFAVKVGPFKTVVGMREDIRAQVLEQKQKTADDELKDALVGQLVEKSTVPVPQLLVDDQVRAIEQDARQNLMYRGMSPEQYMQQLGYKDEDAWREAEFVPAATKRVQAGLVLSELSKVEKIEVTTDELNARLAQMLEQYASMKEQLDTPEARRDIANRVLTEKTVDRLVEINSK